MLAVPTIPFTTTLHVRDACLCLHTQRAARVLARRFDEALRPAGLTNEQFSLLMALNRPVPATMGALAALLGADRTTLTSALKTLERRGLAAVAVDADDARVRRITLTERGRACLAAALPPWTRLHAVIEAELEEGAAPRLRRDLVTLATPRQETIPPALCAPSEDIA